MNRHNDQQDNAATSDYVTFTIADQLFGIPVLKVQDVLGDFKITQIPTAPKEIAGSLNLRGHIVTAIDIRRRLNLPDHDDPTHQSMSIVVDHEENLYSFIIDHVGDVMSLSQDDFDKNPPTLDPIWQKVSEGIFQLDDKLLIVIDIPEILKINNQKQPLIGNKKG